MLYLKLGVVFVVGVCVQYALVKGLTSARFFQPIYDLSPQSHQKKTKTPSMGGIGILVGIGIGVMLFSLSLDVLWVFFAMVMFGGIGFYDDVKSFLKGKNQGLSAAQKFMLQVCVSFVLLFLFSYFIRGLSVFELVFYSFVMIGTSNATNLTDGLDGLLAGCSLITLLGFTFLFQLSGDLSAQILCNIVMFSVAAFFLFNRNPAAIFMGDTGSLLLGAGFSAFAIVLDNVWVLLPLGAVYIMETVSVIIQVVYYKWTKKRVFLMAPLHHHFELMGVSEKKVVWLFWVISLGFGCSVFFI